jgi:diguanylate cyclase (GGDEF)-like protein
MSAEAGPISHESPHRGIALPQEALSVCLLKLGMSRTILLVTASSTVLSLGITAVLMSLFGVTSRRFWLVAMSIATLAPLIIATLQAFILVAVLHHLHASRELARKLALTDELTGLYNRHHFNDRAAAEFQLSTRQNLPLSVVLIDADHFKSINDCHGHSAGDMALQAIARACTRSIRLSDVLGRYGGDEFALLLPITDTDAAVAVAERIRETVEAMQVDVREELSLRVTVSLGIATLAPAGGSLDELIRRADRALYHAKHSSRNRVGLDRGGVLEVVAMPIGQGGVS